MVYNNNYGMGYCLGQLQTSRDIRHPEDDQEKVSQIENYLRQTWTNYCAIVAVCLN